MSGDNGLLRGNATTLVLAVLRDEARHGYDIAREVERRSERAITFKHGTLYPVLHALEKEGLITSVWEHPTDERPRRVYRLTDTGDAELVRRLSAWSDFANAMNKVIFGYGGTQPAE